MIRMLFYFVSCFSLVFTLRTILWPVAKWDEREEMKFAPVL